MEWTKIINTLFINNGKIITSLLSDLIYYKENEQELIDGTSYKHFIYLPQ